MTDPTNSEKKKGTLNILRKLKILPGLVGVLLSCTSLHPPAIHAKERPIQIRIVHGAKDFKISQEAFAIVERMYSDIGVQLEFSENPQDETIVLKEVEPREMYNFGPNLSTSNGYADCENRTVYILDPSLVDKEVLEKYGAGLQKSNQKCEKSPTKIAGTVAHEIGHIAGLEHVVTDEDNLMFPLDVSLKYNLTDEQKDTIRKYFSHSADERRKGQK